MNTIHFASRMPGERCTWHLIIAPGAWYFDVTTSGTALPPLHTLSPRGGLLPTWLPIQVKLAMNRPSLQITNGQ
jgi:hypothetical protein